MATITIAGDLLCSPRMTAIANGDYRPIFAQAHKLKHCDYLIGNVETPIAGEDPQYTCERFRFNTPVAFLDAVRDGGFDMLTLANNHCMDQGEEGLVNTIRNGKARGFDVIGAYESQEERDAVFIKELDGIRVAFINYTYGTNAFVHNTFLKHPYRVNLIQPEETRRGAVDLLADYADIERAVRRIYGEKNDEYTAVKPYLEQLKQDIRRAKEQADYVIMLLHCGGQYVEEVDPYSRFIARKIKEFGADIIVGNHQHIIQRSKRENDYLTVFCQGNMLYDNYRALQDGLFVDEPSYNAVLHLDLKKEADGKVSADKSFSVYTTARSENGLPVIIDSADVYGMTSAAYIRAQILHYANLFAGKTRYETVQERYVL